MRIERQIKDLGGKEAGVTTEQIVQGMMRVEQQILDIVEEEVKVEEEDKEEEEDKQEEDDEDAMCDICYEDINIENCFII